YGVAATIYDCQSERSPGCATCFYSASWRKPHGVVYGWLKSAISIPEQGAYVVAQEVRGGNICMAVQVEVAQCHGIRRDVSLIDYRRGRSPQRQLSKRQIEAVQQRQTSLRKAAF